MKITKTHLIILGLILLLFFLYKRGKKKAEAQKTEPDTNTSAVKPQMYQPPVVLQANEVKNIDVASVGQTFEATFYEEQPDRPHPDNLISRDLYDTPLLKAL